jgi:predicted transcriptional regulator
MSASKPARLTSALLTRKGMASPSAIPATRTNMVESTPPQTAQPPEASPPPAHLKPVRPLAKLSDWIGHKTGGVETVEPVSKAEGSAEKRVRVSLRLDADRHVRLKLVATHLNRTLQSVFTQAIDEFFERHAPDTLDAAALLRIREQAKTGRTKSGRKASGNRGGEH